MEDRGKKLVKIDKITLHQENAVIVAMFEKN